MYEVKFLDSFIVLVILDEVELLASPLDDQDRFACNTCLLEVVIKPSNSIQFEEGGLER